jgi:hypothetical protein
LRDNAPGSCSGESPEDNLKINESHWLVAAEKFSELLTPITALLKQPQLAVEQVSVLYCFQRSESALPCTLLADARSVGWLDARRPCEERAEGFGVHEQQIVVAAALPLAQRLSAPARARCSCAANNIVHRGGRQASVAREGAASL